MTTTKTKAEIDFELERQRIELENNDKKADSQRRMAWLAALSMPVYALLPLIPIIPTERLDTIAAMSDILFISQASIVGMFFGAQAYMSRK